MENKLVSIIMPVYNAEDFLDRSIASIRNQTYTNWELFLVNDGSSDRSADICDRYAKEDARIKVIHQHNQGTAAARNTALKIAQGEYIAFIDNDDFIHLRFYEKMLDVMLKYDADVVVCELTRDMEPEVFENQDIDCVEGIVVDKIAFVEDTYDSNWTRNTAPWNKIYKRKLFDNVCFPAGKGYEDAYTTYRLIWAAETIVHINIPLYYWYRNENSYSSKKTNPRKLFFREEAIRQQSLYYKDYPSITQKAQYFYLKQVFMMCWELQLEFVDDAEMRDCQKRMKKVLRRQYRKSSKLCQSQEEKERYIEMIYPRLGVFLNRFFRR